MARLRQDFAGGFLAQDLSVQDTVAVSPSFAAIPAVTAPDYFPITFDPTGPSPEIAWVVSHDLNSASVTVTRAAEQGGLNPATAHASGKAWIQAPTAEDYDGRVIVATSTSLPASPDDGTVVLARDNMEVYAYLASSGWFAVGGVPVGVMYPYAAALTAHSALTCPPGYLFCNGQAVNAASYPALYNLLVASGSPFGVGPHGNPRVPDTRNRVIAGAGGNYAAGATGGVDSQTITLGQMPNHTHPITDPGHAHGVADYQHAHSVSDPSHSHRAGPDAGPQTFQFILGIQYNQSNSIGGPVGEGNGVSYTEDTQGAFTGLGINPTYANIAIIGNNTGITQTGGVAGLTQQTGLDMRQPYIAVPWIIKAA